MRIARLGVLAVGVTASLLACSAGNETAAREEATNSVSPRVVKLSVANRAFQAPDTIDAGWTTLRFTNDTDEDVHYAHFVRLDSGRTVPELVEYYARAIRESGPRPTWIQRFGGPGGAGPHQTASVTQNLVPGSYVWICPVDDEQGEPHFGVGEYRQFVMGQFVADGSPLTHYLCAGDPSLELTPRAVAILPQLARGLSELEGSLRGQAPFEPQRARHVFRMGCADYFQAVLFGPLLALLQAEAPGIELRVVSHGSELERLDDGTLDVALLTKTPLPSSLSERRLFSDGFRCMLRKGHPALRRKKFTLDDYLALGHVFVAPGGTSGSYVDTELQRRGASRRIALQVSSFLVAPLVVSETDLISTGPERLLKRMSERYPIVLLPSPLELPRFDLSLVWHSRREHDPAHAWLRDAITRAAREI